MPFVLPSDPSPGNVAPASWGDAVRAGLNYLANPPACRVYNNASISLTSHTDLRLTFNSERFDTDSMHSTSSNTGRITITTAGLYVVTAGVDISANATGRRTCWIHLNGTTRIASAQIAAAPQDGTGITVTTIEKLAAGDYVEVWVNQNSGSTLSVVYSASHRISPEFAATWVGLG